MQHPLSYTYAVTDLGAGACFGNPDTFARTSRTSDLQGFWHAGDDQHYAGNLTTTPAVDGTPMTATTTSFYPAWQTTRYEGSDLLLSKTFFVPLDPTGPSRVAYVLLAATNTGTTPRTIDLLVDLRWNPSLVPYHSKAHAWAQGEKVITSRLHGKLVLASTVAQPYTHPANGLLPPGQTTFGNPQEARVFGGSVAPETCRFVAPSRVLATYKLDVPAGQTVTMPLWVAFSDQGEAAALTTWNAASDHAHALITTAAKVQEQLGLADIYTPDAVINRGLGWGKLNTFRVMDRYAHGKGFTNDPPQDILVVRDAAWYAMGASYLAPGFIEGMWDLMRDHATHDGGKLTEFAKCSAIPAFKDDDGLNINDDTPLWIYATHHHYAVTGDRAWLAMFYPQVTEAAEWILAQRRNGLIEARQDGTNVFGIASWRNIIPGYTLNGAVTEINAECVGALRSAAELAQQMDDPTNATRWASAAEALATAMNTQLVTPENGLYALARNPDGTLRPEVTADLVFPLVFEVAPDEMAARITDRLLQPDFWSECGLRTVATTEPEYDPTYGWGLMGGIWPNLTAWACFALRKTRPDILAEGMTRTYAKSEPASPVTAGRVVPGEFPEWFDGDTFESRGMAMSPWMPPTFVWLAIEGLAGLTPHVPDADGKRGHLAPNLPADWSWIGGRNLRLGADSVSFFQCDGILHVAGSAVTSGPHAEIHETDVTDQVTSNAPWTVALQRGTTITVFVAAAAEPVQIRLAYGETILTSALQAGEGQIHTFQVAPAKVPA
ncbi:MAG: hypothetical protein H7338_00960 [Candidatus Sericytochromatia bacterium]|nr:hypothetical protein [Candidatus Sericytochromatia bacterium]